MAEPSLMKVVPSEGPDPEDLPEEPRRSWHLRLAPRIVAGVSVGVVLMLLIFAGVTLSTLSDAFRAVGLQQVTVARLAAAEVAASLRSRDARGTGTRRVGGDDAALKLPALPAESGLQVELWTSNGRFVQAATTGRAAAPAGLIPHSLLSGAQPAYRMQWLDAARPFTLRLVACAPVPGYPSLRVVVQQSEPDMVESPRRLLGRTLLVGAVALALAVLVAWLDVGRVVRPLRALTAAAERFAAGQLSEPIRVDRRDELGTLARAFETMRQQLRRSLDEIEHWNRELEARVRRRTEEYERRNRQLVTTNEVAELLSAPLDVTDLMSHTLDRVREATGFDVAACRLRQPDQTLTLAAGHRLTGALATECVEFGHCLCGRAAMHGACQVGGTMAREPLARACCREGILSAVAVPLIGAETVEGVLFLGSRTERRFESGDLNTLAAIGRQVGMAIANHRLYAALQQRERERAQLLGRIMASHEDERRRLAGELHDEISQALASILMEVESLPEAGPTAGPSRLDGVRSLICSTIENVHQIAAELRPSLLDDVGLVAAIERLGTDVQSRLSLLVDFQAVNVEGLRLLPAAETALFRIAQAALSNVARHAAASTVSVLLQRRGDRLLLVVEDDGRGFEPSDIFARPLKDRLGFAGILERAELIGARTTIESHCGRGTTIFVDLSVTGNLPLERVDA